MPWTGSPIGSTPIGFGASEAAPEPPAPSIFSRYINPGSKDYEVDGTTGGLAQMPGTRQRILLALATALGTSTVLPGFGLRWGGKLDQSSERRIRADVRLCIDPIIRDGSMRLNQIDVEATTGGRVRVVIHYDDLVGGDPAQSQDVLLH